MGIDITFRVPLRWLFAADEFIDLRDDVFHQPAFCEQVEAAGPVFGGEDAGELVTDALGAYFCQ